MIGENAVNGEGEGVMDAALEALSGLFDVHELHVSPFSWVCAVVPNQRLLDRAPTVPSGALPASGRYATGCGLTAKDCRRSGTGEAVELLSSCAWGDECLVDATPDQLGGMAIPAGVINGFSAHQLLERDAWNRAYGAFDWCPSPNPPDRIAWIASRNAVDGSTVYLPADAVLIGRREAGEEAAVSVADSNGCAAGATPDDARLAALLELIERDAAGRWWYGRRRRGVLPTAILSQQPGLRDWLVTRLRTTYLLDITTDIAVPVVAAVSIARNGSAPAIGFAARLDLAGAALAATVEMLAVETSLLPVPDAADDPVLSAWLRLGMSGLPAFGPRINLPPAVRPDKGSPAGQLAQCVGATARVGCRVLFVDLTRAVFGVPVFRAVVPELCHYKPRFAKQRLLQLDGRDEPSGRTAATTPNPVPLLI
jgi:ribosomal protein S12 methylthiotransferase accessory factor